jgi:hypothetical protein
MMINRDDDERKRREAMGRDEDERKRREAWIGMLGAAFLGVFLLFGVFQGSLFGSFHNMLQGLQNPVFTGSTVSSANGSTILVPQSSTQGAGTQATSQATPTVAVPTATPLPAEGPINVLFTGGSNAVQSNRSYTGAVTLTVSGTGQAQGTSYSDAFYIYTDLKGNNISSPTHHPFATLCINGQEVGHFVQSIPPYSATHTYTFTITAPGGPLIFGVCDTKIVDNTGLFSIKFA